MTEAIKSDNGNNQITNWTNSIYIPHAVFHCYSHQSHSRQWHQEKVKRSLLQAQIKQWQAG